MKQNIIIINLVNKLIATTTTTAAFLMLAFPAFAEESVNVCPGGYEILCQFGFDNIQTLISRVFTLLITVAILISVGFLIYGGIRWIISGGDKTAVESARNHVVAAIVGLVISLVAFFIIQFVLGLVGVNTGDGFLIPPLFR